jgi:hypothetical protein
MSRGHQILTAISPLYLFALVIVLLTTTIGLMASLNTSYQQIGAVRISLGKISSEMAKLSGANGSDAPSELMIMNDLLNNHVGLAEQLLKQNTDLNKDNVRLKNRTAEVWQSGCRKSHGPAAECLPYNVLATCKCVRLERLRCADTSFLTSDILLSLLIFSWRLI